jgi:hypothetical protein
MAVDVEVMKGLIGNETSTSDLTCSGHMFYDDKDGLRDPKHRDDSQLMETRINTP